MVHSKKMKYHHQKLIENGARCYLQLKDHHQYHNPTFLEPSLSPSRVTFQQSTWNTNTEPFLGTTARYQTESIFGHHKFETNKLKRDGSQDTAKKCQNLLW